MMRIYIAGPMTGLPDFNYPAFFKAAESLREAGYEVENPAENHPEGTASWLAFMRMSLVQISRVDGIALLPGWRDSKGARLEQSLGTELGLEVRYLQDWLGTFLPLGHEFDGASKFPSPDGDNDRCGVQLARYPCGRPAADHQPAGVPRIARSAR